jgi:hypothetical protein
MKNWVKVLVVVSVLVVITLVSSLIFGSSTGNAIYMGDDSMREFVRCLNEKEVVLFGFNGNLQVKAQLNLFGDYSKDLSTIDCKVNPSECVGVIIHPSWKIQDRIISSALSLGMLSQFSGCKLE